MEALAKKATADPIDDLTIVRQATLARTLDVSRQTLWRMVRRGELPEPIVVSEGVKGWRLSTLRRWIAEREAAGGGNAA